MSKWRQRAAGAAVVLLTLFCLFLALQATAQMIKLDPQTTKFFALKKTNINATSTNIDFGFIASRVAVVADAGNSQDLCVDWGGGTALCPAADTAGDDVFPAGLSILLDAANMNSISLVSATSTVTAFVRAWQ